MSDFPLSLRRILGVWEHGRVSSVPIVGAVIAPLHLLPPWRQGVRKRLHLDEAA